MIEELTLGEIEEIEMLLGVSIEVAEKPDYPQGRYLRSMYWIIKRRENPEYKFEDTKNVKPSELAKLVQPDSPKDK